MTLGRTSNNTNMKAKTDECGDEFKARRGRTLNTPPCSLQDGTLTARHRQAQSGKIARPIPLLLIPLSVSSFFFFRNKLSSEPEKQPHYSQSQLSTEPVPLLLGKTPACRPPLEHHQKNSHPKIGPRMNDLSNCRHLHFGGSPLYPAVPQRQLRPQPSKVGNTDEKSFSRIETLWRAAVGTALDPKAQPCPRDP